MLAVGTAATVIIVLIGLIPSSLDQMSAAAKTTAEARVVQAVAAGYQMRPWQDILQQQADGAAVDFCFDTQGAPATSGTPEHFFTARVLVQDMPALPGTTTTNDRLRQVLVLVTDRTDTAEAFENPRHHRRHPTIIAQTDKQQ